MGNKQITKRRMEKKASNEPNASSTYVSKCRNSEDKKKKHKEQPVEKIIPRDVMLSVQFQRSNLRVPIKMKGVIDIDEYNTLFETCTEELDIDCLIDRAINNRQYEFLEYLCVQELMCTQRWKREVFLKSVKTKLK